MLRRRRCCSLSSQISSSSTCESRDFSQREARERHGCCVDVVTTSFAPSKLRRRCLLCLLGSTSIQADPRPPSPSLVDAALFPSILSTTRTLHTRSRTKHSCVCVCVCLRASVSSFSQKSLPKSNPQPDTSFFLRYFDAFHANDAVI